MNMLTFEALTLPDHICMVTRGYNFSLTYIQGKEYIISHLLHPLFIEEKETYRILSASRVCR